MNIAVVTVTSLLINGRMCPDNVKLSDRRRGCAPAATVALKFSRTVRLSVRCSVLVSRAFLNSLPSVFLAPDLKSRNLLDAPAPESHVARLLRVECPLKEDILLVKVSHLLADVIGEIYPQAVLADPVLVVVLVQVDRVALKLQSDESNYSHKLAVVVFRVGDELNEGNIQWLRSDQRLGKPAEQRQQEKCAARFHGA